MWYGWRWRSGLNRWVGRFGFLDLGLCLPVVRPGLLECVEFRTWSVASFGGVVPSKVSSWLRARMFDSELMMVKCTVGNRNIFELNPYML